MADDKTKTNQSQTGDDKSTAAKSGDKSVAAEGGKAKTARAKTSAKTGTTKAAAKTGDKAKAKTKTETAAEGDGKTKAAAKKPAAKTKAATKPRAKVASKADKAEADKPAAAVASDKTKADDKIKADDKTEVVAAAKVADKADKAEKVADVANVASAKVAEAKTTKAKVAKGKRAVKEEDAMRFYGTGRRKEATARVFLRPGNGDFVVNKKPIELFFPRARSQMIARQALKVMGEHGESGFDVYATVAGGGESGQAEAVRHGVSRAMVAYRPDCKPILRAAGFIARDARAVERKKVGLRKARRARQYSKR